MAENTELDKRRWFHRRMMSYAALAGIIMLLLYTASRAAEAAAATDIIQAGIYALTSIVLGYFGFSTWDDIKKP